MLPYLLQDVNQTLQHAMRSTLVDLFTQQVFTELPQCTQQEAQSDQVIRGDLTEAVQPEQLRQRRTWERTQRRSDDQRNVLGGDGVTVSFQIDKGPKNGQHPAHHQLSGQHKFCGEQLGTICQHKHSFTFEQNFPS